MIQKISVQMQVRPRGEGRIKIDKGTYDAYKFYMNSVKDLPEIYHIDRKKFGNIIKDIHSEIIKKILYESCYFRMPCGLPSIRVRKYKRKVRFKEDGSIDPKSLAINWLATRKLWEENKEAKEKKKLVYFINDHTDGYSANIIIEKYSANVPNLSVYRFKPSRDNDRELATILLNPYNKIDYYE